MSIKFTKYQATGNDFIIIDNRNNIFLKDEILINKLCDRKFGVGADGLILLENSNQQCNFKMIYYNSDGKEGSLCGNGSRSIVDFAKKLKLFDNEVYFETISGILYAKIDINNPKTIHLKMNNINEWKIINENYFINTGSPHLVLFKEKINEIDVYSKGKEIRYSPEFVNGTNVNFVEINNNHLFVRTYERGVENETLSCGTGVTASALAYALNLKEKIKNIPIKTKGGDLSVSFNFDNKKFTDIFLSGPATEVFKGEITV